MEELNHDATHQSGNNGRSELQRVPVRVEAR